MEIRMNRRMDNLKQVEIENVDPSYPLHPRLAAILHPGFEEVAGCIVFSHFADSAHNQIVLDPRKGHDELFWESFINHIHLEDIVTATEIELRLQASAFVDRLAELLEETYPTRSFEIVWAVSDEENVSHTVRFHRTDVGGTIYRDLESFQSEAVLVMAVPDQPVHRSPVSAPK